MDFWRFDFRTSFGTFIFTYMKTVWFIIAIFRILITLSRPSRFKV